MGNLGIIFLLIFLMSSQLDALGKVVEINNLSGQYAITSFYRFMPKWSYQLKALGYKNSNTESFYHLGHKITDSIDLFGGFRLANPKSISIAPSVGLWYRDVNSGFYLRYSSSIKNQQSSLAVGGYMKLERYHSIKMQADYWRLLSGRNEMTLSLSAAVVGLWRFYNRYQFNVRGFSGGISTEFSAMNIEVGGGYQMVNRQYLLEFKFSYSLKTERYFVRPDKSISLNKENSYKSQKIYLFKTIKDFRKRNKNLPSFATMLHWGIEARQALKILKQNSICVANHKSRLILRNHNWKCYQGGH